MWKRVWARTIQNANIKDETPFYVDAGVGVRVRVREWRAWAKGE
jgi:hypothetical protein